MALLCSESGAISVHTPQASRGLRLGRPELFLLCGVVLAGIGCGDDTSPPPGTLDGAVHDAGGFDGRVTPTDGAVADSSATDAGPAEDAANGSDSAVADAAVTDAGGGSATCPPTGPFGTSVGETAMDVELVDCEGNPVSLHEFCGESPSWLYHFAEWCPPCQDFARNEAQNLYDRFAAEGVSAALVISQDRNFESADQADCQRLRDELGLDFPVLIDPSGALGAALGIRNNAEAVAFGPTMEILYSRQYDHSGVAAAIEGAL